MQENMVMFPGSLKIYKKIAAASFTLLPPQWDNKGYMDKHGAILLEIAPGEGDQVWNWNKKLKFAISIADICTLTDKDPTKHRCFHEHHEKPKTLQIQRGEGKYENTYMMTLAEGQGPNRVNYSVPLSSGEYRTLIQLFDRSVPLMLGWTSDALASKNRSRGN